MNIDAELVAIIESRDAFQENDLAEEFVRKMSEAHPVEWAEYTDDAVRQLVLTRIRRIRSHLRRRLRKTHIREVATNRAKAKTDPSTVGLAMAGIADMHYATGDGWSRRIMKMTKKQVLETADHMQDTRVGMEKVELVLRAVAKRLQRDNQRVEDVYTREQLQAMFVSVPETAA